MRVPPPARPSQRSAPGNEPADRRSGKYVKRGQRLVIILKQLTSELHKESLYVYVQ